MRFKLLILLVFLISCKEETEEQVIVKKEKPAESKFISLRSVEEYINSTSKVKPNKSANSPFNTLSFDKVIAYEFEGEEERNRSIYMNGFSQVILQQQVLNQKQSDILTNFLSSEKTYGNVTSACFYPKLGLVFFEENKVNFTVDVCLDCNYLKSSIEIPSSVAKKRRVGDNIEIPENGFSKAGQEAIIKLCNELGLEYGKRIPKRFN